MGQLLSGMKVQTARRKHKHNGLRTPKTLNYFDSSTKDFMINYRVDNLQPLLEELRQNGLTIADTVETYDYGKFVHILYAGETKFNFGSHGINYSLIL